MASPNIQSEDGEQLTPSTPPLGKAAVSMAEDRGAEAIQDDLVRRSAVDGESSMSNDLARAEVDKIHGQKSQAASDAIIPEASNSPTDTLPAITSNRTEVFENDLGIDDGLEYEDDDVDSAIGSNMDDGESTFSVESSVYNFVHENGHTYHSYKDGKYLLPNDEIEQERLDMQHHLWLLTLRGKLHLAPLDELKTLNRVLDIGTGTGIWAIEFANQYPLADITGTDLSPIQPEFVPPNCRFEIDDVEDEWLYSTPFNYIHGRSLHTCFADYYSVIKSAFNHLAPGGYLELQDPRSPPDAIDNSVEGTSLEHYLNLMYKGSIALGLNWESSNFQYKKFFEDAGFVDVVVTHFQWPSNGWAKGRHNKLLGEWYNTTLLSGFHGLSVALLSRGLNMTAPEIEVLLASVRKDLRNKDIHAYTPVIVIYGRKPE